MAMKLGVLGPIVAIGDRAGAELGGPRQRRLLAALVLHGDAVVSTDRLLDVVFDGDPPEGATTTIRSYIARLRRTLTDAHEGADALIVTGDGGYRLCLDDVDVDAARFEASIRDARRHLDARDPTLAAEALTVGLDLWRGEPYGEFAFEEWAQPEVGRLHELRLTALEELNDAKLACGLASEVVSLVSAQVDEHPLRERMRSQQMLALFRVGRHVDALRTFDAFEQELIEVGLEPSDDLRRLARSVASHDPALRLDNPAGQAVRGYRVGERIGAGTHGVVIRAVQPGLDREVAIKTIRPELADDVDFIRRFDAEAQLVASLEHPHIVPIYDYWREPGGAYIVMRLLDHDLERWIEDGPMEIGRVIDIVRWIGGALAEAHRRGVVHGDVKPSNVLVDDSGAYLTDFGVASLVGEPADLAAAMPASGHESPEVLSGEPPSMASDQFAFAVLVVRLLTGQLPFGLRGAMTENDLVPSVHGQRRTVPAAVDDVIWRATRWDADERYPDVATLTDELADALGGQRSAAPRTHEAINPYRGLRAFGEPDRGVFFGRTTVVEELVAALARPGTHGRFVMTVGASGGGKSSIVRAGLIPALRDGAIEGSDDWLIATMVPGDDPHHALDAALRTISTTTFEPSGAQRTDVQAIIDATVLAPRELVLVIDQFEELFTRVDDESIRRDFLDGILHVVQQSESRVRVIATLRADFLDRPLQYAQFGQLVKQGSVAIAGLSPVELEEVVTKPAAQVGVDVEPALTTQLIADVVDRPAALPLLQFALTGLFDRRTGPVIRLSDYLAVGGVAGGVADAAEAVIDELSESERDVARRAFLRLVTVDDGGTVTRRRARRADLASSDGDSTAVEAVVERFGDARLLAFDHDADTRQPTVEIAHEAMIEHWPRFADWIDVAGDDLRTQARARDAAATWDAHGRDDADLYRGLRLEHALAQLVSDPEAFNEIERNFLEAGERLRAEQERESLTRAERDRRSNRRLRGLLVGVGALLAFALAAGAVAFVQRQRADDEAAAASEATDEALRQADAAEESAAAASEATEEAQRQAEAATASASAADVATLISRSAALTEEDPEISMLLALEAHRRSPASATEQAVLNALGSSQIPNRVASFPAIVDRNCLPPPFTRSDGLFGYAVVEGRLRSLDLTTGEETDHGAGPGPCGVWLQDPSTGRVVVGNEDANGAWVGTLDDPYAIELDLPGESFLVDHTGGVVAFAVIDGTGLAQGAMFNSETGEQLGDLLGDVSEAPTIVTDPSGSFVMYSWRAIDESGPGRMLILDASTGEELFRLETNSTALDAAFDQSTLEMVTAMRDGTVLTTDLLTGEIVASVETTATTPVFNVGIRPDGLVVAQTRGQVELIDRRLGPTGVSASTPDGGPIRVRPDGSVLVSLANADGFRLEVIELDGSALVDRSWPVLANARVSFNAGQASVWDNEQRSGVAVDLATGRQTPIDLRRPDGTLFAAENAYTEVDGAWAIGARGTLARFRDGELVREIEFSGRLFTGTRFDDLLAVVEADEEGELTAHLVDLSPDAVNDEIVVSVDAADASSVHPSIDGGIHVITQLGLVRTFDSEGEVVSEIESGALNNFINAMDPTTGVLALETDNGGVVLVDTKAGEVTDVPGDFVVNLGFDGSGLLVITEGRGLVRVWDLERNAAAGTVWSGPGNRLASPSWFDEESGTMWVFASDRLLEIPLEPERWIERACEVVGRELTSEEWARHVPGDVEQQAAC